MDKRRTNTRSGSRDIYSSSKGPRTYKGEIDRYNNVDRDIYSSSNKRAAVQSARSRKAAGGKRSAVDIGFWRQSFALCSYWCWESLHTLV